MTRSIYFDAHPHTAPIVIHVQFAGQRFSIPLTSLDIGTETADRRVKSAVATRLLVTPDRLDGYVIDRHPDGNLTLRPKPDGRSMTRGMTADETGRFEPGGAGSNARAPFLNGN